MAQNLLKAGHRLVVYDAMPQAVKLLDASSDVLAVAQSPADLVAQLSSSGSGCDDSGAMHVVSMLPNSEHVQNVHMGANGLLVAPEAIQGLALVDCSTIDPAVAREVGNAAATVGTFVDAPVSGGVVGAENASLTFMVGGDDAGVERSRPLLALMGKSIVHCGPVGSGQAAKLCNNLVLAVSMAGVAEGMLLGQRLGVDKQTLASIFNTSSARCWSSDTYNPCPGVMEGVPAAREFEGGFATSLMLKVKGVRGLS